MRSTICLTLWLAVTVSSAVAEDVTILARKLSAKSENISPEYEGFGNLTLCVGGGGFMEWNARVEGGP